MDFKQLKEFLVVAQERQITAAAKRLYMAQPPLSYQMKQLEKQLGTKLFIRNSYGIELTDAGKTFQQYARKLVNMQEEAQEAINQEHMGEMGTINLGLISSTGGLLPNKAIQKLTAYYPKVNFEITEGNTMRLIDLLNNRLIDVAIVRTPFNLRGLERKDLYNDQMVAVCDPEKFPLSPHCQAKDLDEQPIILYRRFEAIFNDTFAQLGISPFYSVKCDDARTAIMWANAGMGIAIVPKLIAQSFAKFPLITIDHPEWDSKITVVWEKDSHLKPINRRFIELLISSNQEYTPK